MCPPLSVTASASMRAVACAASVAYATSAVHAAAGMRGGIRHPASPRRSSMLRDGGEAAWGGLASVSPKWRHAGTDTGGNAQRRSRPCPCRRSGGTIQDRVSYDFQQLGAIGLGRSDFSDIVVEARSRMAHRVENLADPDFGQIFEHLYLSLRRAAWLEVDYEGAAKFRGRTVGEIFRVPIIVSRRLV